MWEKYSTKKCYIMAILTAAACLLLPATAWAEENETFDAEDGSGIVQSGQSEENESQEDGALGLPDESSDSDTNLPLAPTVPSEEEPEDGEVPDVDAPDIEKPDDKDVSGTEETLDIPASEIDTTDIVPVVPNIAVPVPKVPVSDGWQTDGSYWVGGSQASGWVVVDVAPNGSTSPGLQRYWVDPSTGLLVRGSLIEDPSAGGFAYARPEGWVVRGVWSDGQGNIYIADNEGRLMEAGWNVTDAYTSSLQRYYIDPATHAAKMGYTEDGYAHWTLPEGYVARGRTPIGGGVVVIADNEGLITKGFSVVDFGEGLQRYFVDTSGTCTPGLHEVKSNSWVYTLANVGYVVRGKVAANGMFYLANNEGVLAASGWLVTDSFDGGLQRYYIDPTTHSARPGTWIVDGGAFNVRSDTGYVWRSRVQSAPGRFLLANNEGMLAVPGWLVTDIFGQGLQRYWIEQDYSTATGFFRTPGNNVAYYTIPNTGYILRGKAPVSGNGWTQVFLADNEGVLADFEGWLVTDIYDGGMQRYRLDQVVAPGFFGAHLGRFTLGGSDYYGREDQGYVVRGAYHSSSGRWYIASNDGVLVRADMLTTWINNASSGNLFEYFNQNGFSMSVAVWDQMVSALSNFWACGYSAGFVFMDMATGIGGSYDADRDFYAASCMKVAYVAYICEELLDTGMVDFGDIAWMMEESTVNSNNDTYMTLRRMFGDEGFDAWLNESGIRGYSDGWYPYITPSDLSRIWVKIANYEMGGSVHSNWLQSITSHAYYSPLYYEFGSSGTVYSKPGWISGTYNDAGVIFGSDGRAYLITMLTTANPYKDGWMMRELAYAIQSIVKEIPLL